MDNDNTERQRCRGAKRTYKALHAGIAEILFRHNLAGAGSMEHPNEYEPEAGAILARLPAARSPEDVGRIFEEVMAEWFGRDASPTGAESPAYALIASDIWDLWQEADLHHRGADA
ncbi:MAG TPA: hypothetical protein VGM37_11390 [Armatimonadota bacterium]|jgi:hypothetical protein